MLAHLVVDAVHGAEHLFLQGVGGDTGLEALEAREMGVQMRPLHQPVMHLAGKALGKAGRIGGDDGSAQVLVQIAQFRLVHGAAVRCALLGPPQMHADPLQHDGEEDRADQPEHQADHQSDRGHDQPGAARRDLCRPLCRFSHDSTIHRRWHSAGAFPGRSDRGCRAWPGHVPDPAAACAPSRAPRPR